MLFKPDGAIDEYEMCDEGYDQYYIRFRIKGKILSYEKKGMKADARQR